MQSAVQQLLQNEALWLLAIGFIGGFVTCYRTTRGITKANRGVEFTSITPKK